jgi:UDP-N-acetylmuramoyl-L-alanyl-D-glutamate--2,6-diaminopimelate ligase
MAITIQKLFENIVAEIPSELLGLQVKGVHYDSRKIKKDFLFIAVKGFQSDGHKYLKQVAGAGALAAVVEDFDATVFPHPTICEAIREAIVHA